MSFTRSEHHRLDVILDIETYGSSANLDLAQKEYIIKRGGVVRKADENPLDTLALHPLTSRIIAVSLYNADARLGFVYYHDNVITETREVVDQTDTVTGTGNFLFSSLTSEEDLLTVAWEHIHDIIVAGGRIITWNGRGFDIPFLNVRSAVNGIGVRADLLGNRYDINNNHVDVADVISGYGAFGHLSLDCTLRSFSIPTSKQDDMSGKAVHLAFERGEHMRIARYCANDTTQLGELWCNHIRPYVVDPLVSLKSKHRR
jgi:hypothetical protein